MEIGGGGGGGGLGGSRPILDPPDTSNTNISSVLSMAEYLRE